MAQNEYYLMHHGVKGQKWGVRRTPAQLGHKTLRERAKTKLNDPEFKRKAATAAKIALVVGAAYATHKVINDPRVLSAGKDAIGKVMSKSGTIKASALKSVMNTTEFKAAKTLADSAKSGALGSAAKTVAGATGKALKKIGSDEVRNTITGIGAMAGTAAILKNQIKDFRENKPDGDAVDRALKRTQQLSEMGENVNTLARGPKGSTSSSSNSSSSSSSNNSQNVSVFSDSQTGAPIRANRKLSKEDKNKIKQYRSTHPNLTLRETLDELGWLDKDEAKHSAIPVGWHFNTSMGNYYIF